MNVITLIGKIDNEPVYTTPHKVLVGDFHFVTRVPKVVLKTNEKGEEYLHRKANSQEFNVRIFDKDAQKAQSMGLKKGDEVYVEGHLELQVHIEKEEEKNNNYYS